MKQPEELYNYLLNHFSEEQISFEDSDKGDSWILVQPDIIYSLCNLLRDDKELRFNTLMCLSGVHYDKEDQLGVTYHLNSTTLKHSLVLKVNVARDNATVPSVEAIWKTANWHEREAYDMFGIRFPGHPNLERILCPDDWEGFPLLKDYEPAETYQGMTIKYETVNEQK